MRSPFSARLYQIVGTRIRDQRSTAQMNQEELAHRVGLSRTSITNIELGKQRLLLDHLFNLAGALNIEPAQLIPARADIADGKDFEIKPQRKMTAAQKQWAKKVITGK